MGSGRVQPRALRPGGRTTRVRAQVLQAAGDVLAEQGFTHLDLADVARRAGVGKTTVYRRWGTVAGLVADLLIDMAEQSLPRTETGILLDDLKANAQLVRRTLADARQGSLFKSIIAAAMCDARAASAMHGFYDTRIAEWVPCVQQAIERGEVPQGTDTHKVIRAVSAPLYYHLLVTGDSIDETMADQAAQAAVIAARAGVYMRPGHS
ncbi:MAG: TetR family transcriptional regulator [Acidimicrobiales bacterium]|nr:MAG: TetR family transcriptional regulator [Acidimicrobiales bacterium]